MWVWNEGDPHSTPPRGSSLNVCLTGGTGSLGRALAAYYLTDPACERIVILSRDEQKQAQMASGLGPRDPADKLRFFLGDVRDRERLAHAFAHCNTVIHCAALKRVDAVAYSPSEARKTNVEGSVNVVAAALGSGVTRVLMISSDKAVEPINFYGVTKQMMEQEAIASNAITVPFGLRVSCTRWGNVLGSRGGVVGIFKEALRRGDPLPITDARCTRFWLTLDGAVRYVQRALEVMEGGEVLVPTGLPAAGIVDVARAVAPEPYPLAYLGLRAGGEKVHEVLATAAECQRAVERGALMAIPPEIHPWRVAGWGGTPVGVAAYTSEWAPRMTHDDLVRAVKEIEG